MANSKVVHLGTEIVETSAPVRIHNAVRKMGFDSEMLVLRKRADVEGVYEVTRKFRDKVNTRIAADSERRVLERYGERENVPFSFGNAGVQIHAHSIVRNADLIHFHWIAGQFLSHKEIHMIMRLGKPVIWTFHDSWPMTGGCHVRYGCEKFMQNCGECPILHSTQAHDITNKILEKKRKYYIPKSVTTVSPSEWMLKNVEKSSLFCQARNVRIGNPLDLEIFCPVKKNKENNNGEVRILFGASGALELEYKGYNYLVQAMKYLSSKHKELASRIVVYIFGTTIAQYSGLEEFKCVPLGYISSEKELADMYSNADLYVFPSIDDNLPGTVMESLACETPVVAFETGGVPEMVKHKRNGYIARYKDYQDLADGIAWVCENNANNVLGRAGRKHIEEEYAMERIAAQYIGLYENLMEKSYE